jgi:tripartite-type tricarboxylate transporter receptor subunit TctC
MRVLYLIVAAMAFAGAAHAAPNGAGKPLTIIAGASRGEIRDVMIQLYAVATSSELGRPVRIGNRPSATSADAAAFVEHAASGSNRVLAFQGAQHVTIPLLAGGGYDALDGFAPVTMLFTLANFPAVPAACQAQSVADLVRLGRQKNSPVFGSSGMGTTTHLTAIRLAASQKIPVAIRHYAGAAPMISDLVADKLDFPLVSYTLARPREQAGAIRLLAVDAKARWPDRPDLPTLREAGVPQPQVASWFALAAPAHTPPTVIAPLHDAFGAAARGPKVVADARKADVAITVSTPDELHRAMEREAAAVKELVPRLRVSVP